MLGLIESVGKMRHHSAMLSTGLAHKRILVTRATKHVLSVSRMVQLQGGVAVPFPCLAVEDMPQSVAAGVDSLACCDDVLFTSVNGVDAVVRVVAENSGDLAALLRHKRVAAVGGKTATALAQSGIQVHIIPEKASQDGLIDAYERNGLPNGLLFFRAEEGRDDLSAALLQQGVKIVTVPAYRTVCPQEDASEVIAMLQHSEIDAVLLGSAKTAAHYLQRIGSARLANRPVLVAISAKMADSARSLGLNVQVVAKVASFEAMLDALAEYFDSGS